MVVPQLILLGIAAVGGYFFFVGGRELYTVFHILRNDPVPIRTLDGYTGPVEIEGTAVTDDEYGTVRSPLTGTDCLAYTYEVQELRSSGKNSNWETLDEGMGGVNFLVDDTTDRVRVDPEGADIRLDSHSVTVPPGTELPESLARYVAASDAVDEQDRTLDLVVTELAVGNKQRFIERRLDPGEHVYVYGLARRGPAAEWGSNRVDAVVGTGAGTPVFVISDTDERGTAWRIARKGLLRAGLGFAVVAFAALFAVGLFA
ncbi:GIDE domain-containing protein [Halomicroarcula sp. GCM10025709]|uniref:GIDE domain-containing protein n=1 Tax=Haloarcula TaxID=2237 RepID=UPI0024C37908|nr:GIDE domain-containing protein [Halomicroarcula sp. YJ-61-S]